MKPSKIPVAFEGIPYILFSFFVTFVFALLRFEILSLISLIISFLVLNFFRDPERVCPADKDLIISPADGVVINIANTDKTPLQKTETIRISIFMNIFNVHVNRIPFEGEIVAIEYYPGIFLPADKSSAMIKNERNALLLKKDNIFITVVQVAGLLARRIVCWTEVGDRLNKGQRFGLIQFGSRVDVYLPKDVKILVNKNQKVVAGETPIAKI
jgi:phosphatidylserine decarboxylase